MLFGRPNIIVIAEEAHRSQYDVIDGFDRHIRDVLPQASFIGFTGTPIDVYDLLRLKEDKATAPIYYKQRLAKIDLKAEKGRKIDPIFEEMTDLRLEKVRNYAAADAARGAPK